MNDLEEALAGIAAIRGQISRSAEFRGYGPMTVAATGIMAVVAGQVQALGCESNARHLDVPGYLDCYGGDLSYIDRGRDDHSFAHAALRLGNGDDLVGGRAIGTSGSCRNIDHDCATSSGS